MRKRLFALSLVFVSSLFSAALLQGGPASIDPEKTDADFKVQGEYVGEIKTDNDTLKIGAQIIAMGGGKFTGVGYVGGLPGDGWNQTDKVEIEGEGKDGVATFKKDDVVSTVKDGVLSVEVGGVKIGELKRVIRKSPTLGAKPPEGATVLFDGKNADEWEGGKLSDNGLLQQGTTSKRKFGSHKIHIEFLLPYMPEDRGQGRGNSGIYVQGRYEVQMLDSFGLEGKDNECGGLYSVKNPDLNMCFPPLSWQTYDIDYTAAKFDSAGKLTSNPRVTVLHNGVIVHKDVELPGERSTTAAPSKPGPEPGPIHLQDHGNPLRYRNIWVVEKK